MQFNRRTLVRLWQFSFLLLGATWLLAPQLNHILSYQTSLISQYEALHQPYAWFFRLGDILTAGLLIGAAFSLNKHKGRNPANWLLLIIGFGMLIDPIFVSGCRPDMLQCREQLSISFVIHALETVVTATSILLLSAYDSWIFKRIVSISFVLFQIIYALLLISQLSTYHHLNTISQYIYQTLVILWLAWYVGDKLKNQNEPLINARSSLIRKIIAAWVFLNGVVAILASLAHLQLFGSIRSLYFAGNNAWLAQHGVIVGALMIYLSRHIARGERRARQLFLAICGIEVIKYSLITPHPLLILYLLTFSVVFVLADEFDRGTIVLTWEKRFKEAAFVVFSLAAVAAAGLILIARDNQRAVVTAQSINHFFDYAWQTRIVSHIHVKSALLAHTITALLLSSIWLTLWILFRPFNKQTSSLGADNAQVLKALANYSRSSEDYFKLWPSDKEYYYLRNYDGFIAYKLAGPIAFALADPIAQNKTEQLALLNGFISMCRQRRLRACFLPIFPSSKDLYVNANLNTVQIGASALIKTDKFLQNTIQNKWWRWQKNRAARNSYSYSKSIPPHSLQLIKQFRNVSDAWLALDVHEERGFALGHFDEDYLQKCVVHYLTKGQGVVVAFTNELPELKRQKTATVDLLRYLPESNNTMPFLLLKTIESIGADGHTDFDLGFVPFASAKGSVLNIARTISAGRFSSKGLEQFKNKFGPVWQENYMAYDGDLADLALIAANLENVMKIT